MLGLSVCPRLGISKIVESKLWLTSVTICYFYFRELEIQETQIFCNLRTTLSSWHFWHFCCSPYCNHSMCSNIGIRHWNPRSFSWNIGILADFLLVPPKLLFWNIFQHQIMFCAIPFDIFVLLFCANWSKILKFTITQMMTF